MGVKQSVLTEDLAGFLETGGGARLITLCGPTTAARLAQTCEPLAAARAPWASWEALQQGCAAFAAQAEVELIRSISQSSHPFAQVAPKGNDAPGPFNAEALIAALPALEHRSLLPDRSLLNAMCRICGANGLSAADVVAGLDELCLLLARGADPEPLILWARAMRKPGLMALLQRATAARATEKNIQDAVNEVPAAPCSTDALYASVLSSNVVEVLLSLASGVALDVEGPKMLNGDPGCCSWSLLSASVHNAGRKKHAICVTGLLIAARADADTPCCGPCGWTPLMWAAQANSPEACQLLVMAQADPRRRHAGNRNTALDMANKETARAIKDARERRNLVRELPSSDSASGGRGRRVGGRGAGRGVNVAALGYAGRGKPAPAKKK